MQSRQGYCNYCHVRYNNLEQHIFSAQHRNLTTQNRSRMGSGSLMERFLQDVLCHHPYQCQESRLTHNERQPKNTVPPEVADFHHFIPEEMVKDDAGIRTDISTRDSEPTDKLLARPQLSQKYVQDVLVRPSVIQKLEKGHQYPLEFVCKIESSMEELNPTGGSQDTNNGQNVICPPVIPSAPTGCLFENSYDKPVPSNTEKLPLPVHLDPVHKCDPTGVDNYAEKSGKSSSDSTLPSHPETSSVSYQKPKELNRELLCMNPSKSTLQKDVKSQGNTLSAGFKFQELMSTVGSLKLESLSKLAVSSQANLNINISSNKDIFEDSFLKSHKKLFSNKDQSQEEKDLFFNQSEILKEKSLVYSEMEFDCTSLQSLSDQSQEAVEHSNDWKEEQHDTEDKNWESRDSEMSSDYNSSLLSFTEQPKARSKERNLPTQVHAGLPNENSDTCISEISSDSDGSFQLVTKQSQVALTEASHQKGRQISLVDKSYESSSSEMNFDCDTSLQSITDCPQQSVKDVNLPKGRRIGLVDIDSDSSSSEVSADSPYPLKAVVDSLPVKERKVLKKFPIGTIDKDYESSCSETSVDCKFSLQSVVDHPQLSVMGENPENRHVDLKDKNGKPSSVKGCLDCDISLQTVTDEPKRTVVEINLRKKNVDLVDKDSEYHGPKTSFQGGTPIMTAQPHVAIKDVNPLGFYTDPENKSDEFSISDLSLDSHDSFYKSANDQPQGNLDETNLKQLNVDMEVKSYDGSSSELTFDSDPILSVKEQSWLDFEGVKDHINQKRKGYESDSSEITFDSDISLPSVDDHPQVTVYEEECAYLDKKSNASCVSEITFDSDIPHQSDTEQSKEIVHEMTVQEKEHVHLERMDDKSTSSEISLYSDISLHSVTNPTDGAIEKVCLQKEQIKFEKEENELSGLEFRLDYDRSVSDCSEVSINERNFQKQGRAHLDNKDNSPIASEVSLESEVPFHLVRDHSDIADKERNLLKEEHAHLESKKNGSSVSEISLECHFPIHLITDHPDIAIKKISHQKEHVHSEHKDEFKEFALSEARWDSGISLQSVNRGLEVPVEETQLQNKKHTDLEGKSAECAGSEIILDSDIPHCLVTELQTSVEKMHIQKEESIVLESKREACSDTQAVSHSEVHNVMAESLQSIEKISTQKDKHVLQTKSHEYSSSKIFWGSDFSLQSATQKFLECSSEPQHESTAPRGFERNTDSDVPLHSITDQHQLPLLKERHFDLEDKNSESSVSKIHFNSDDPLQSLAEQIHEVVKNINLWKEEDIGLENKTDELSGSTLIHDSEVSLQTETDQREVAAKQISLEKEDYVCLEDKDSQYSGSEMSLDSDFLLQSIIDQPQITFLDQEHIELEDKHSQSCGSELSSVSDDPLQSAADQLQKAIKERNLWKDDDVNMEKKKNESGDYELMENADVLQSVAGQTGKVRKDLPVLKEHVDLEDKMVKPSGSIRNCSDEPFHSVADEGQEAIRERSLLRKKNVCLDDKGYKLKGSEVIYTSHAPMQSVIKQAHILKEEYVNLEEKSNDPCDPEISFDSDDLPQLESNQHQKADKGVSLWKEDHIYLEDKKYKLGDFEVTFDSDAPVQFVADHSPVVVRETNFQKKGYDDLEHEDGQSSASERKCDGDNFQVETDELQVVCRERKLQEEKPLDIEGNTNEPSDSEMMCDSDGPFQIVVNQSQMPVKETNLHKVVFLDLVTGDSDCEVISDSDIPIQPVIDPPQMTVKEINCKNANCIAVEDESYDSWGSEVRYVYEDPPQLVATNQSKEIFKLVNQKGDYIVLEDLTCDSCGSEIDFNANVSHQSMTYQSQEPDKNMENYILEGKSCESSGPKRSFNWEDSSQSVANKLKKTSKKIRLQKNLEDSDLKKKSCEFNASVVGCDISSELLIHDMTDKQNSLNLNHTDRESMGCGQCGSQMNLQCDLPFQCDSDQTKDAVNSTVLAKKIPFGLKDNHVSHSSSVFMVDPLRELEKAKVIEDNPDEPVLEALPHVPASFVGKTWSQIMREDDAKINALVKEFREGRFHCYFDDDCETRKMKKKSSNVKKKVTWADLTQGTAPIQVLPDCDDTVGGVSATNDFSMALHKPCLHSQAKRPYKQECHVGSQGQTVHTSERTKSNFSGYPVRKRKIIRQEEDSPKSKYLVLQKDKITKEMKLGTSEFPESNMEVLKPLQPNAFVCVPSQNAKLKEGESFNFSETRTQRDRESWGDTQYTCEQRSFSYYDPLTKQIVIDPLNTVVPEADSHNWADINFDRSDLDSSAQDNDASASFMIVPVRYGFTAHQGASGSSVFLEKSEALNASEVPKESNFHLSLLNPNAAQISTKSVKKEMLESKKTTWRRKLTSNNKSGFPQKAHSPVILQQKTTMPSEKQSLWIRTKPSDIIRKYTSKYSAFLHRQYQSKSTCTGMHFKREKSDANRLKKMKKLAKETRSVPSAGTEERIGETGSSAPNQPLQESSCGAGRKDGSKNRLSTPKQPFTPVKMYALRSLSSQMPRSDGVRTRLSHKLRGNKVNEFLC
ncbi:DBF4-type zinc finger-containing protein 2 [Rhynchocyon petersi]